MTLFILPDMAELIWFLLSGYRTALLNTLYLINLIQDIWSIQQLNSSIVRHICAQCAKLDTSTYNLIHLPTTSYHLTSALKFDMSLYGHDLFAGQEHQRSQPNRHCWQVDPLYNHDDDERWHYNERRRNNVMVDRAKLEWVVVVGFHTESGTRNVFVTVLFLWNPDKTETQFCRRWVIFWALQR